MKKCISMALALFIIVILSLLAAMFGYGSHKAFKDVQLLNHKLDSLNSYSKELKILQQTIIITYPVVSAEEAQYYAYIFYTISSKYKNVDPCAFAALIKIESGWNPTLASSKDCRGLTQIKSTTAEEECKLFNIEYKKGVTEWNDIINLILGLNYFSSRYNKNGLDYAIHSYIGGDGFANATGENQEYINKYSKDFMNEYKKVYYIHRGVQYEATLKPVLE